MQSLFTIGHSTRELDEFLDLLRSHGVARIVDVRRFPGSRRHPHFGGEALAVALRSAGFDYRHAPALGGRRKAAPDSPNRYWRNDSFRAYADYMATPDFQEALRRLLDDARERPTAIMCAEAVPWRCHRNMISDAVVAAGIPVAHITGPAAPQLHTLNEGARLRSDGTLVYPGPEDEQGMLPI